MNQILLAAARGARIQELEKWRGGCSWGSLTSVYLYQLTDDNINYRIHPDDEYYRFGPISTALREMAVVIDRPAQDEYWRMARDYYLVNAEGEWPDDELHRSLFLLFLSEALCDEGL